ncbi:MAG: putative cytokinetic ring protein SteA [Armatimonadota bacterium]|nr:putative cytokinetic ring protein SteA [Armatimonadota bacterium]
MPGTCLVRGAARPGRRTKHLIPQLRRGDIAIIDHPDLDALSATGLLERRVGAVVNASPFLTGRYPASGPGILLAAGIPLFDCAGTQLFNQVKPGVSVEVTPDGVVRRGDQILGSARPFTREVLERGMEEARRRLPLEMDAFVRNTLSYLTEEWPLLFDEDPLPALRTPLQGRHAVIVVRGEGYREDLQAILPYLRDVRPVLIGVDGGADALLSLGLKPHIILGDMDSVSDAALRCGAELVVHGYPRRADTDQPAAPGLERLAKLGLEGKVIRAVGMSEDVAMILAERMGARLIVAVGTHFSLQEFLDKGRKGMSSTFLTRLKVGSILVDAKGVSRLYRRGIRARDVVWLVGSALLLVLVVLSVSPQARAFLDLLAVHASLWLRRL